MAENKVQALEEAAKQLLFRLSSYAKAQNLTNRRLAEQIGIPYGTIRGWWFFTEGKDAHKPSDSCLTRIEDFLESRENPEAYRERQEARRRTEKIKYLLLLLEDELKWFRDNNHKARDEFRKALNSSDVGYISSLLSMLSDEDKFSRWLALTTLRFQSFRSR